MLLKKQTLQQEERPVHVKKNLNPKPYSVDSVVWAGLFASSHAPPNARGPDDSSLSGLGLSIAQGL